MNNKTDGKQGTTCGFCSDDTCVCTNWNGTGDAKVARADAKCPVNVSKCPYRYPKQPSPKFLKERRKNGNSN